MKVSKTFITICISMHLSACAPEPGSLAWCEKMDETVKGEWTLDDAAEYTKSCILRKSE